jgi:hypothetical protein
MNTTRTHRINVLAFVTCVASIAAGVAVGLLGVWDILASDGTLLWRCLASSGILFVGGTAGLAAVHCFRSNETF